MKNQRSHKAGVSRLYQKQSGFTLVELMVAITLGLIILGAIGQIFSSSRSTYHLQENLARVQESGRFAIEFLSQDIRMAGYIGCNSTLTSSQVGNIVDVSTITFGAAAQFNPDGMRGYKYAGSGANTLADWDPDLPADYFVNGEVAPFTDVIIVQHASSMGTHLTGNTKPSNANIQILGAADIAGQILQGDILMISDCKAVDIFVATNDPAPANGSPQTIAHSSSGNTQPQLTHAYDDSAELMKLVSRAYYIGRRGNVGTNPPALFRKELGRTGTNPSLNTQELVEGVEKMTFFYGVDNDSTSDRIVNQYYPPASINTNTTIPHWRNVVNVRVGLLVRSINPADTTNDSKSYQLPGEASATTFTDKYRRRMFTSTIQVRNH